MPISAKGNPRSPIWVIGEAPGTSELEKGIPFVGASGMELERMLAEANVQTQTIYWDNCTRERLPGNDISEWISTRKTPPVGWKHFQNKWLDPRLMDGIAQLQALINQHRPQLILALGNVPLWALTGKWGIGNWRGSQLKLPSGSLLVPTYHPAAVLRNWEWRAVVVQDFRRAWEWLHGGRQPKTWYWSVPEDVETITDTFNTILTDDVPVVSVDIETRRGQIICVGIAWTEQDAICIPLLSKHQDFGGSYWSVAAELSIIRLLQDFLTNPRVKVLGQNFAYDVQYFARQMGFLPNHDFDTMLAQHVAFAGLPKALHFLASMYCEHYVYWKEDGKLWDPSTTPIEDLFRYNCEDCLRTMEVHNVLFAAIKKMKLASVYQFQMELARHVDRMNLRGIKVDQALRASLLMDVLDAGSALTTELEHLAGTTINPRSSKQVQDFIFTGFNIPVKRHKKTQQPTVDDATLTEIGLHHPPLRCITDRITALRSLGVFSSTFLEASLDVDGRIRTSFNVGGTETYRFSSRESPYNVGLNLQNIPVAEHELVGGWKLANLRTMFIPDTGYVIYDVDLISADAQVVAAEAGDLELLQLYASGEDVHTANAKTIWGECSGKNDPRRHKAKAGVHLTNYGGSARTLARTLGVSMKEAELFQSRWFSAHPGIKLWHERVETQLKTRRTVENRFGYRRVYFDRIDGLLPQALAWIPQSTVACVINRALVNMAQFVPSAQLLLQVHDSLVFQLPGYATDNLMRRIHQCFQVSIPYSPPLIIGSNIAFSDKSWGLVKPMPWPALTVETNP